LLASGHGSEFLEARLDARNGVLRLEIIAEYGDNPMIANEAEAQGVLADALHVQIGMEKTKRRLAELSPLTMAPRAARDPRSPMPREDSGHGDHQHNKLLGASWHWAAPEGEVRFVVPETNRQTVLFWLYEPDAAKPKWSLLVPGDSTPAITVKHPWWKRYWIWVAFAVGGILGATIARQSLSRRSGNAGLSH
jgi:hypothetical protein